MQVELSKHDLLKLLCRTYPVEESECKRLVDKAMMLFTGDVDKPNWEWNMKWLNKQSEEYLLYLYRFYS